MKPGDITKICFLPVGAVFETSEYGRGTLKSSTHKYGETPGEHQADGMPTQISNTKLFGMKHCMGANPFRTK